MRKIGTERKGEKRDRDREREREREWERDRYIDIERGRKRGREWKMYGDNIIEEKRKIKISFTGSIAL